MRKLAASTTARIIGALLVLAALWFVADRLFLAPGRARTAIATTRTEATAATAQAGAAKDTLRIIETHHETLRRIDGRTEENTRAILASPGADTRLDPALHRAGLRALCLRDNQRDPSCPGVLLGADADQGASRPDPARQPAG